MPTPPKNVPPQILNWIDTGDLMVKEVRLSAPVDAKPGEVIVLKGWPYWIAGKDADGTWLRLRARPAEQVCEDERGLAAIRTAQAEFGPAVAQRMAMACAERAVQSRHKFSWLMIEAVERGRGRLRPIDKLRERLYGKWQIDANNRADAPPPAHDTGQVQADIRLKPFFDLPGHAYEALRRELHLGKFPPPDRPERDDPPAPQPMTPWERALRGLLGLDDGSRCVVSEIAAETGHAQPMTEDEFRDLSIPPRKRRRRSLRGLGLKRAFLAGRSPDPADAGVHRAIAAMQRPTRANEL